MSVATFDKGQTVRSGSADRAVPGFLSRVSSRVKRYVELSRAERELDQLDDRLLLDIGLNRGEIRRMVWGPNNQR
ncbi:uncharacterized protein YjiS (DUF1127 family) [Rhodoligotrophos appendicifer]|uniref:DUF1127 domain-containing protein n=1 Tax=Rhodoligotrophos appendicifer TaxID=987056 RepID=UPI00118504F9|nr:DUF1127 domain-containing protein [Rhodoligotrophos appendicifer]